MILYDNIEAVQAAYFAKAKSKPSPRQGVKIGGKLVSTSEDAKAFKYAAQCPVQVTAKVLKKDISGGLVRDEAPIQITSETPDGFLDGAKNVFAFFSPDHCTKSGWCKPESITDGGLLKRWSTVVFPAKHNFMVKSVPITETLYRSVIDGGFYAEADLPENDEARCLAKYSADVKAERNARISDTDDLVRLEDMTIAVTAGAQRRTLTDDERTALMTYRQALRDLPESEGFPFVAFPSIPDALSTYLGDKIDARDSAGKMMEGLA